MSPAFVTATDECPGTGSDSDSDGLSDVCEQQLAERFAPIVYHYSDELNFPTSVDDFLKETALWFKDDDCLAVLILSNPSQHDLINKMYPRCFSQDMVSSSGTRSDSKWTGFYLADVPFEARSGNVDSTRWITYFHAYPREGGGVTVQYWRFYPFDSGARAAVMKLGIDLGMDLGHGGDWEGIHVVLDKNYQLQDVGFLGHKDINHVEVSKLQMKDTHVCITSDRGSHTSRPLLRQSSAHDECMPFPTPHGFVRQESWPSGTVTWPNRPPTQSGPLLNLGSKTAPMNDQVFVQYSGLWGSHSFACFLSGYWGPAYNETGKGKNYGGRYYPDGQKISEHFMTAWCEGMERQRQGDECVPKQALP
jgi:hypothetical protein